MKIIHVMLSHITICLIERFEMNNFIDVQIINSELVELFMQDFITKILSKLKNKCYFNL